MGKKTNILIIAVIVFLIIVAVVDPVRSAVGSMFEQVGGTTATALEDWWAGIVANPYYIELHVLIWLVAGMVLMYSLLHLHSKNKLPLWKKKQPVNVPAPMGPPTTVILQTAPTPTSSQQQPTPTQTATPVVPPDQNKQTGS
jgi:hypothetical protein